MKNRKISRYVGLTFGITYLCWWGLAALTQSGIVNSSHWGYTALHLLGGFGPTIGAIAVLDDRSPAGICKFTFSARKSSIWYLFLFCALQALVIGASSMERNPSLPWFAAPIVLLSATFIGGGNEELGWRGILQPELEKRLPFPVATLITGCVWMAWHIPLWFVQGTSQQGMNFGLYCIYGIVLSFWLAMIRKKTESVLYCAIFHGFSNLVLSFFLIRVNWLLVCGLLGMLALSVWLTFHDSSAFNVEN